MDNAAIAAGIAVTAAIFEIVKGVVWLGKPARKILRLPQKDYLNPNIFIKAEEVVCEINKKNRVVRIDKYLVKGVGAGASDFKVMVLRSAAKNISLSLERGGTLKKIFKNNIDEYTIFFPKKIKRGEEHEIILRWDVGDLTEAPFLLENYNGTSGIRHARYIIIFPQNHIKEIKMFKITKGNKEFDPKENIVPLPYPSFSYPKQQIVWEIGNGSEDKASKNIEYQIKWQWNN